MAVCNTVKVSGSMEDYVIIVSCVSAGLGLLTNVETPSGKKRNKEKEKQQIVRPKMMVGSSVSIYV